jgi:chromosome segregation ATPase
MNRSRLAFASVLGLALAALAPCASAAQEPSPAEAARRAREQRRPPSPERKVWTNDNLPTAGGAVSVVGASAAEPAAAPVPGAAVADEEKAALSEERKQLEAELETERAAFERERNRQNLLQRDYNLRRQQFYSNPNYASDSAGLDALNRMAAEIEAQGRVVDGLRAKVDELEKRLGELENELGPRPEEPLTEEQQREHWRARLAPLREELARVEAEIARLRGVTSGTEVGLVGVPTADRADELNRRRAELRQQIAAVEDEARRAGVPPAWLR